MIVYTSNAVSNPVPFAKPMDALNSGDFDGTWGAGNAGTVGALRTLLTIGATNYQPLFIFDHNENARSPNLEISGKISIYRGNAVNPLASYALDTIANGAYDQSAYVLSCGEPSIGPAAPTPYGPCSIPAATDSGNTYSWKTTGSGKPDYYAIFDDLNLYDVNYLDSDKIVIQMSLRGNESGFEELAIGGYKYASTNVPEPGSLAMLGLGFGLMAFISRRRAGKSA
ncbi:MAG: PEP-CTERM sorting domain-containing protein [Dechloromonas sp.]|uniref:PEP-CTERM sorting domain-containing protein n=1 Tax=Candidatus Dechloromonas phosphorivorans TaxID=2899244 RepID=A0A935JVZ7_9RHOO|nr:PEP-CTERM sorting domain-containing protein [Candidatus Dechloromonas phosphorivorans]